MIQVLIVDDHPLVANGIAAMLTGETYIQIAGTCKTAAEALTLLETAIPDIILLDINLPDIDGLELCFKIKKLYGKSINIIGLSSSDEVGIISQFLARGGNGYLLKNIEREELLEAINAVLDGKIFVSKSANQKLLEQYRSVTDAVEQAPILTRREKEVLQLLYDGLNGPQISEKLFLSHYTVETHRKNLMQKLNVSTTQSLLKTAKELKLF